MLPPEVLDRILGCIIAYPTREGKATLIACALVATWWTGPSQRRLFSSVTLTHRNYQRWMSGVVLSGSKAHLLGYVRSLEHVIIPDNGACYSMRSLQKESGEYLSALYNIRRLSLGGIKAEYIDEAEIHACCSAFRETLTELSLADFVTSFNTFATLVGYFPNVTSLQLSSISLIPDDGPVPSFPRPLRGKIFISSTYTVPRDFIDRLAELDVEYEAVEIECRGGTKEAVDSVLQLSAGTVKYLKLGTLLRGEDPSMLCCCNSLLNHSHSRVDNR